MSTPTWQFKDSEGRSITLLRRQGKVTLIIAMPRPLPDDDIGLGPEPTAWIDLNRQQTQELLRHLRPPVSSE